MELKNLIKLSEEQNRNRHEILRLQDKNRELDILAKKEIINNGWFDLLNVNWGQIRRRAYFQDRKNDKVRMINDEY